MNTYSIIFKIHLIKCFRCIRFLLLSINYHKCSGLKQHPFIYSPFWGSAVLAWRGWVLCSRVPGAESGWQESPGAPGLRKLTQLWQDSDPCPPCFLDHLLAIWSYFQLLKAVCFPRHSPLLALKPWGIFPVLNPSHPVTL